MPPDPQADPLLLAIRRHPVTISGMKLIPQYSIRWLLAATAVVAVAFSIVGAGYRGHLWATGVSAGMLALVILLVVCGALFALVWVVSVVTPPSWGSGLAGKKSPFKSRTSAEATSVSPFAPLDGSPEEPLAAIVVEERKGSPFGPEPTS